MAEFEVGFPDASIAHVGIAVRVAGAVRGDAVGTKIARCAPELYRGIDADELIEAQKVRAVELADGRLPIRDLTGR